MSFEEMKKIYEDLQKISWFFNDHNFEGVCCVDLSLVEFMSLKIIYENGETSVQDVGKLLNYTKSGSTRIINRLEKKGYITKEKSSKDNRFCCIRSTFSGKEVIDNVTDEYTNHLSEKFKSLSDVEIRFINEALKIILNKLSN